MLQKVLRQIDDNLEQSLTRLFALLRLKSISTDPAFKEDCVETADWLVRELQTLGFRGSRRMTDGNPMVVAHHHGPSKDCLHVLFYGHYDVQPVDPLELWHDDPFQPALKKLGEKQVIVGRGAADDKGQLMTFIEACRAFKAVNGELPVAVTILLEGEEESGSPSFIPFLESNSDELKADLALVCDTTMWNETTPSITMALRGLLSQEITIKAANRDLHSGLYGGAAANPITILSKILADLHDANGHVTIPHFYDGVEDTPKELLQSWHALNFRAEDFLAPIGLSVPYGENNYSLLELIWARPTAEVNGISGGHEGEGFKTVIPSTAHAKVSFRLVQGQDPNQIRDAFQAFVRARVPVDCSVSFKDYGAAPAFQLPYDLPFLKKAQVALSEEWAHETALVASGGSIPCVGDFQRILNMPSLLVGFSLDDDNIHAPNEKYDLKSFHKGQRSWARILLSLAN